MNYYEIKFNCLYLCENLSTKIGLYFIDDEKDFRTNFIFLKHLKENDVIVFLEKTTNLPFHTASYYKVYNITQNFTSYFYHHHLERFKLVKL